jgi:hypothetical protein
MAAAMVRRTGWWAAVATDCRRAGDEPEEFGGLAALAPGNPRTYPGHYGAKRRPGEAVARQ